VSRGKKVENCIEVFVKIHKGGLPELFEELKRTPPRKRAERLRTLALLGYLRLREEESRRIASQEEELQETASQSLRKKKETERKRKLQEIGFVKKAME